MKDKIETNVKINGVPVEEQLIPPKFSHKKSTAAFIVNTSNGNPWTPDDVDKMEFKGQKKFKEMVEACRFFYARDSIASTVINKLVDIGINEIKFVKNGLTDNEIRIFEGLKETFQEFAENMALEFLISGLVIPETKFTAVGKDQLNELGIKKYTSLVLPTSLWLRDPKTVTINDPMLGGEPSYFVDIPEELIYFIIHKGDYKDGNSDPGLYAELKAEYPEFVALVENGKKQIILENDYIFRRKPVTGDPYPTTYLSAAIESLKHKRNLRRMDYSIAARVIGAIQLFRLGSDLFPVTEDDQGLFDDIRNQMFWRDTGKRDVERIFQLFANHTLDVTWVFPPTEALLDDKKYSEVNRDVLLALGVSNTLLVGEAERSNASNPELSTYSTVKTMNNFRDKIIKVLTNICAETAKRNGLKFVPRIKFVPLNLAAFKDFAAALGALYDSGSLSRSSYLDYFGYNFEDETDKRESENVILKEKELGEFAPAPFSPAPTTPGGDTIVPTKPKLNNDKSKIPSTQK